MGRSSACSSFCAATMFSCPCRSTGGAPPDRIVETCKGLVFLHFGPAPEVKMTRRNRVARQRTRNDCRQGRPAAQTQLGVSFMTEPPVRKSFGVIDDGQRRAMSGLEFVQGLVNGTLPLNTMAETLGYDVVEVSKG